MKSIKGERAHQHSKCVLNTHLVNRTKQTQTDERSHVKLYRNKIISQAKQKAKASYW